MEKTEKNKTVIMRLYSEVLKEGEFSVLDDILDHDYEFHGAVRILPGPEGFKDLLIMLLVASPDFHVYPEDMLAEGDKVAVRFCAQGTHSGDFLDYPPTGKYWITHGIDIFRLKDEKIIEHWNTTDRLDLLRQKEKHFPDVYVPPVKDRPLAI